MDGIILNYDPKSATGVIKSEDGKIFQFRKAHWHESRAPRRDDRVDFEVKEEKVTEIYLFQEEYKPAPKTAVKTGISVDIGLIAGGYAVVFFAVAIFDVFFFSVGLAPNDYIALSVILDILTIAAWIWSTNYKVMRRIATLFAGSLTALELAILARHMLRAAS